MKYLKYIIALILIQSTLSQNKLIVDYGVIYNQTQADDELKRNFPDYFEKQVEKEKRVDELIFSLKVNGNEGVFTHQPVNKSDEPLFFIMQNTDGDHIFYHNLSDNIQLEQFPYWGENIIVENNINETAWTVTKENKRIHDFLCFKATKSYTTSGDKPKIVNIEAWFAPEIPFKFGPKNYAGLPGLIIELKENHLTYFVKSINYNPKEKIKIIVPTEGTKMTWEEFAEKSPKIKKKAKQTIINSRG